MTFPKIFAVIHLKSEDLALKNAELAFKYDCDGVFLIDMENATEVDDLVKVAQSIKGLFPDKLIGVNLLNTLPDDAVFKSTRGGLDMTWTDEQLTHSGGQNQEYIDAIKIYTRVKYLNHLVFSGVAFKYQDHEPKPIYAAKRALQYGLIPTTSGPATGQIADPTFIKVLREGIGEDPPLALASGITPENFKDYAPYVSHMLVSTGISEDFYTFSEEKLKLLQLAREALV